MLQTFLLWCVAAAAVAQAQNIQLPAMPAEVQAPAGHSPFLKAAAVGTQNYICLPSANGLAWKFQGPQATLYISLRWFGGDIRHQVATHYLSPNPMEDATPARATWQSSLDSSATWAVKIQESSDPAYVASGAIPWFLLQVKGKKRGPSGGELLAQSTYIQRINTTGGVAPEGACTEAGSLQFVPYTADYVFYRANE